MKAITLFYFLILLSQLSVSQEIKNLSFSIDKEKIIKQEFRVKASLDKVWKVWTTDKGLQSWYAPVVKVDWRRGGTIKSRYKVGGSINDMNTVISEIVDYIPYQRIVLKDNLTFMLSYGMSQKWIENVPNEFMFELIAEGGDIFTTLEFEEISKVEVKITLYMTGYKVGKEWDKQYQGTISSNNWAYKNLIKSLEKGPIDWSKN